jgi:xanthine dehydrogenase accessory factor
MTDFYERVARLRRDGEVFAVATVVGRRPPVSAHLGDHAIVFADGRMEGFVGGACSQEIVRQQGRDVLRFGRGRLISIRPDAAPSTHSSDEHVVVPMTCASEGAVDVYIEPCLRPRTVIVVGETPVASAVARVAHAADYEVVRVVDGRGKSRLDTEAPGIRVESVEALEAVLRRAGPSTAVVVASQGHYDEEAVASALKAGAAAYIGLVASRKRGATVLALVEESGIHGTAAVHVPAGVDVGARTPSEVALSILAEIVKTRPSEGPAQGDRASDAHVEAPSVAIDPVCGMQVEVAGARHTVTIDGVDYYFCGAGCRARFTGKPQAYLQHHP